MNTISVWLLWMTINSTMGIMFRFAFIDKRISIGNILFYSWLMISLVAFIWWVIHIWNKPIDYDA